MTSHELFFSFLAQHENRLFSSSSARLTASRTKVNLPKAEEKSACGTRNNKKNIIQEFITSIARWRRKKHTESISHTAWGSPQRADAVEKHTQIFSQCWTFIFRLFSLHLHFPDDRMRVFHHFFKFNSHLWFCYWICGELNNGKVSLSCADALGWKWDG